YSTLIGGANIPSGIGFGPFSFGGNTIAVDSAGNAYVAGSARAGLPTTPGAFQTTFRGGGSDGFITKLNAAGSALVYSTYFGGSDDEIGYVIAVDATGNAYVIGQTYSNDLPTINPFQSANNGGSEVFIAKLSPDGSTLIYSTYLGGSSDDIGSSMA